MNGSAIHPVYMSLKMYVLVCIYWICVKSRIADLVGIDLDPTLKKTRHRSETYSLKIKSRNFFILCCMSKKPCLIFIVYSKHILGHYEKRSIWIESLDQFLIYRFGFSINFK